MHVNIRLFIFLNITNTQYLQYTKTNSKMQTTYSTAKICDVKGHEGCMPLDPGKQL